MLKTDKKINYLERSTFIAGLLILVFLFGYLSLQMTKKQHLPPTIEVAVSPAFINDKNSYEIMIQNTGEESAQAINIQFELYQEGKVAGNAVMVIDYLPSKSKETGWIVFEQDKKLFDSLVVNSITYLKPEKDL